MNANIPPIMVPPTSGATPLGLTFGQLKWCGLDAISECLWRGIIPTLRGAALAIVVVGLDGMEPTFLEIGLFVELGVPPVSFGLMVISALADATKS